MQPLACTPHFFTRKPFPRCWTVLWKLSLLVRSPGFGPVTAAGTSPGTWARARSLCHLTGPPRASRHRSSPSKARRRATNAQETVPASPWLVPGLGLTREHYTKESTSPGPPGTCPPTATALGANTVLIGNPNLGPKVAQRSSGLLHKQHCCETALLPVLSGSTQRKKHGLQAPPNGQCARQNQESGLI